MLRPNVQPLGHQRDHIRLRDGLAVTDRRRAVGESLIRQVVGEESLPRHCPQRRKDALLRDAALDDLLADHLFEPGCRLNYFHVAPLYRACPAHKAIDRHAGRRLSFMSMRDRRPRAAAASTPFHQRPIVTLTTDFGLSDHYVAQMKAVLIRECPAARLIDVTHNVPRHDILCASITLERAIDGFPKGYGAPGGGRSRRRHRPPPHHRPHQAPVRRLPGQRAHHLGVATPRRRRRRRYRRSGRTTPAPRSTGATSWR